MPACADASSPSFCSPTDRSAGRHSAPQDNATACLLGPLPACLYGKPSIHPSIHPSGLHSCNHPPPPPSHTNQNHTNNPTTQTGPPHSPTQNETKPNYLQHPFKHQARAALHLIRQAEEVEGELAAIRLALELERAADEGAWKDLFAAKECMWYRTLLGFTVQLLQQFSGINAVGWWVKGGWDGMGGGGLIDGGGGVD